MQQKTVAWVFGRMTFGINIARRIVNVKSSRNVDGRETLEALHHSSIKIIALK
jgi:hypothetical protein